MARLILLLFSISLIACQSRKTEADLIVFNARVYTVDSTFARAEAFAILKGRFLAAGSSEEIREAFVAPWMLDAEGKTIVPGLIDSHCHFYGLGMERQQVDLRDTRSFEEVLERVEAYYRAYEPSFIMGHGWDQNDWPVKVFPDKSELDALFPDIPVALRRIDGHALLVNQKALDLGGITAATKVPGGEVILKDGQLTGVLVDSPMQLVVSQMPAPDRNARVRALKQAQEICFANGLTTVSDAGLDRTIIELIDSLQQAGDLTMRIYAMVANSPGSRKHYLNAGIYKTDRLNIRSVKVYADGALGSRGAALKAPYADQPGHYGAMITPMDELEALAAEISAAGFQMNTHAIGDSANAAVLRAYREALEPLEDPRWRIEHAQVVDPADRQLFGKKVIPSVQPTHATSDMYWAEERLGAERMGGAYAFNTLLETSGLVALGTDFPVERVDPMQTFYAAVVRQDSVGYPEGGFRMEEALSREDALKGMTIWGAYANFEEGEKGSIEAGKVADFTILSEDLMEAAPEALKDIRVLHTFVDGKKVY